MQKAGGVYYTPPYIVRYIVEQTIGKKIAGKTPEKIANMRFLDTACGSGSFLVGAYQYLLDYHLSFYLQESAKWEKTGKIYKDATTHEYKLAIEEKRAILLNNIFGVDIDAQAVEVTQLSLFLKLLENEGRSLSKTGQAQLFRASEIKAKILPSMMNNIKCGNSLIGSDYYDDKDLMLFDIAEQRKINVFDWEPQFPQVFDLTPRPSPNGEGSNYPKQKIKVYVFSDGQYAYDDDFREVTDRVELCALPAAILNAYQRVQPRRKEQPLQQPDLTETEIPAEWTEGIVEDES